MINNGDKVIYIGPTAGPIITQKEYKVSRGENDVLFDGYIYLDSAPNLLIDIAHVQKIYPQKRLSTFQWVIILIPLSYYVGGVVVSNLWAWFVMPVFHIAAISIVQAAGLCVFIRAVYPRRLSGKPDHNFVMTSFVDMKMSGLMLFIGYLIHLFM